MQRSCVVDVPSMEGLGGSACSWCAASWIVFKPFIQDLPGHLMLDPNLFGWWEIVRVVERCRGDIDLAGARSMLIG